MKRVGSNQEYALIHPSRVENVALVWLNSPPVNALSIELRRWISRAIEAAAKDPAIDAIVLIGTGRGFCGGADVTEFVKPPEPPGLHDLIAMIEGCPKPLVAALHGMALGGGLELALACAARVAVPDARLGLPEVKLGLLPGAGGTQRLPRLVGPQKALEMIVLGSPIDAVAAHEIGLVDEIVDADDLCGGAIAFARRKVGGDLRKVRDRDDKIAGFNGTHEIFETFRHVNARKFRGFDAPAKCIEAVQAAVDLPFDAGLQHERALFTELLNGAQSAAQRHVFFAERRAARIPDLSNETTILQIAKVGIVGAGTMGSGIAMSCLDAGLPVTIVESNAEALQHGIERIRRVYAAASKKGRMSAADIDIRMGRLTGALGLDALADCDLVIEAVFELMDEKKRIFAALDAVVKPGAILASNTSYLDIDMIAAATTRPDHVLGLHFFSPANVMRLLEVVRGARTVTPVIAAAFALAKRIGKVAVLVGIGQGPAGRGFVGNRMLAVRQREANKLIVEGAMPWDIDRVIEDFGMPMGPFAMADLAGLDLGWTPDHSTGATVRDVLCERGRRGQKTGRGFYDYDEHRKAKPSHDVEGVILDVARRNNVVRRKIADDEILDRCLYPMINEGAKILDERIALRASDIDVVWINGYGWPTYRGGPMYYADTIGLDHVLTRLQALRAEHGADFIPSPLLERLVAEGKRFRDLDV